MARCFITRCSLCLLMMCSALSLKAEEETPTKVMNEMTEYKKHCVILVNLAKTYGLFKKKKVRRIPTSRKEWNSDTQEYEFRDQYGNFISDNDEGYVDVEDSDPAATEDPNSPLGQFYKRTDIPLGINALNRLEKSQLRDMSENCRDLIEAIDQYKDDVTRLKGQWAIFSREAKAEMANLRRAFLIRLKAYEQLVKT